MVKLLMEVMSMLANNNRKIIRTLALKSLLNNRQNTIVLFMTIALSALMLFSVLTVGITYLDLWRLQNIRIEGGDFDSTLINGYSQEQYDYLITNKQVESVGIQTYAGYLLGNEDNYNQEIGLFYVDEIFFKKQSALARKSLIGYYPKKDNEIMVSKSGLKKYGKEALTVNDVLTLTYKNNQGIFTKDFVISGIYDDYRSQPIFFVSLDFYLQTGYELENDGILYIKYKPDFLTNHFLDQMQTTLDLNERQVFMNTSLAENSLIVLLGIILLATIIVISAYLLIYNILYLSISKQIRYYGLLQTLGMTKKQLGKLIRIQIGILAFLAIVTGLVLSVVVLWLLLKDMLMVLGISAANLDIKFYPQILIITLFFTVFAIVSASYKPVKMLEKISLIEAAGYEKVNASLIKKSASKKHFFLSIVSRQFSKDKRKTILVLLSLTASLSVYYCLTTLITSQGKRTVLPNYFESDLIIKNFQDELNDDLLNEIKDIDGISKIHQVDTLTVAFTNQEIINNYLNSYLASQPYLTYEKMMQDYQTNPQKYYGNLKAIDDEEFNYLNASLTNKVDFNDFKDGKVVIMQNPIFSINEKDYLEQTVSFMLNGKNYDVLIKAISYESYYGGSTNIGMNIIVSQEYLNQLSNSHKTESLAITYQNTYDQETEKQILKLIENTNLVYDSRLESMLLVEESQSEMMVMGTVISLLLLLVGLLNYLNTMIYSIQNRITTFAIMEGIGMTRKQVIKLLIKEGLIYALSSILMTLSIGTIVTYFIFQAVNYMGASFTIPVLPLLLSFSLIIFICIIVPIILYYHIVNRNSLIERLRDVK